MRSDLLITCCKSIPSAAAHDVAGAVIDRMLITEYYDGAISGFVQCAGCQATYHFVTLDWSHDHRVRVISLSLLPADSMTRIVSLFSEEPPRSKWIPKMLQRPSDQDLDRIAAFLSEILARAEPPSIVMAWNLETDVILAARHVGSRSRDDFASLFDFETQSTHKANDWFEELGISREA